MKRLASVLAALAVIAGLGLGTASLADAAPVKAGHLLLTVEGETTALPPGQAVKRAAAACEGEAPVTVEAVRLAFPAPLTVCDGVTLTSQVAPEPTPEPTPLPSVT